MKHGETDGRDGGGWIVPACRRPRRRFWSRGWTGGRSDGSAGPLLVVCASLVFLAGANPAAAQTQEQYRYDAAGRLTEASVGDQAIRYTYDAAGNLLERKVVPVPEGDALAWVLGALAALARSRRRTATSMPKAAPSDARSPSADVDL